MSIAEIDGKTIAMGALASLVGYVFYGFINLQAKVETEATKQEQVMSEQRDLWTKYNEDLEHKVQFMEKFYITRLEDEKRWTEYYKERADAN